MSRRLRILHLASWYPSRISPQNGNFIQRHVEAISRQTDSYLLHVVSDPDITEWSTTISKENGFESVTVIYPRAPIFQKFSRSKKAYQLGYEKLALDADGPDLVHVHVMYPGIVFGYHISRRLGIPMVVTEHATAYHSHHPETYSWWQRMFLKRYSRRVRKYFPVSNDLKVAMQSKGIKGDYQVIPNVVDTKLFSFQSRSMSDQKFRFLHISSLKDAHKNVTGLLSAFATFVEDYPQSKLTIIGNEHHNQIERYIRKLRLINQVEIHKEVPIETIAQYMHDNHALLLFSNYENAPCVISEAHCTGMPVIASRVGGIPEMIDESNGILVNKGDMLGLYAAMQKMVERYADYDGLKISKTAQARYQYEQVGELYLQAYESML